MRKLLILSISSLLILCACGKKEYRSLQGATWGTLYHISYNSESDLDDSIIDVMRQIDLSLSPFESQSTVSRINNNQDMEVDAMLAEVFALSQKACSISNGQFDPTVAPLVNLWGFGYKAGKEHPDSASIAAALQSVGLLDCSIDDQKIMHKKNRDTEFNFSAIAKGYGIDRISAMLDRNGVKDYLVEIGGEIAAKGVNSNGDKWRIQIDAPVDDGEGEIKHERLDVLYLSDAAVATSGNYRNYRHTDDGKVGHTIDPTTGMPMISNLLSATIIADRCAWADALATATMAMPDSAAVAMLEAIPGIQAILVVQTPGAAYKVIRIPE